MKDNLIIKHLLSFKSSDSQSTSSSWLELLFDLLYVVLISSILHMFIHKFNSLLIIEVFTVTVLSFTIWENVSFFTYFIHKESFILLFVMTIQFVLLIWLNYGINQFSHHPSFYMYTWIGIWAYRLLLYFIIWLNDRSNPQVLYSRIFDLLISIVVVILGHIFHHQEMYIYALFAFYILVKPWIREYKINNDQNMEIFEYFTERWGLVILMVIAEILISNFEYVNHHPTFNLSSFLMVLWMLWLIMSYWQLYFYQISYIGLKKGFIQKWGTVHILYITSFIIIGGLSRLWMTNDTHTLTQGVVWNIFNGILLILTGWLRMYTGINEEGIEKDHWNNHKKNHIIMNLILGVITIALGALCTLYLPKLNEIGLVPVITISISNFITGHDYAKFLEHSTNLDKED